MIVYFYSTHFKWLKGPIVKALFSSTKGPFWYNVYTYEQL